MRTNELRIEHTVGITTSATFGILFVPYKNSLNGGKAPSPDDAYFQPLKNKQIIISVKVHKFLLR